MNVFFIEQACDGTVGGSHTCLYNLVNNLDRDKYKVWVGFYQYNSYVDKLRGIGVDVLLLQRNALVGGNTLIRKIRNWYRLIYKHRVELHEILSSHRIDLVVLNNSIAGGKDYVHVCNRYNVPLIAYERGFFQYKRSDISLSHRINASIAVSCAIQHNMLQQKYSGNTSVIYDGIATNTESPNKISNNVDIKKKFGIPDNSIVIGIIGNIREWKGQKYFVKAFMSLGEKYCNLYGLVIGGHGPEDIEYVNCIKNIAKGSDVGERLIFSGFRDDVPELLKVFNVFIHASVEPEPFGMVILEAMFHKVPVIATNFGGPVESLANGECGILVPPRDEQAIIDGVEKYLSNPLFRAEIVNRAYKRVESEFDLRKTVDLVDDLFQDVVNRAKA